MKILMLETRRGSEDGFTVKQYEENETYEVARNLGARFIRRGWATEIEEKSAFDQFLATIKPPTAEEMNRIFRPQPTRGSAPTNPATLAAKGEL